MYYPIMLDLEDKTCILFGGGSVATRKAKALISCKARLIIVSPVLSAELLQMQEENKLEWVKDVYQEHYLKGVQLCFACTNSPEINREIANAAQKENVFVNAADSGTQGSFIVPAVKRSEEITLAVSCVENPSASMFLSEKLFGMLENWMFNYIKKTRELRIRSKSLILEDKKRQQFMRELFSNKYLDLAQKDVDAAISKAVEELNEIGEIKS